MILRAVNEEEYPSSEASSIPELKTKLWALSYERASNIVCCENCGTTSTVTRLVANSNPPSLHGADGLSQLSGPTCIDNRFEVVRQLGSGGMGAVYLVNDKILKKPFALKMLREDLHKAGDVSLDMRFQMEAKAALEMTHVNVVGAYCQGRHQSGAPYLVMDYIEGDSLADVLVRERCLEVHSALNIFIQVCQALSYAHTKHLIHRDLKPANILLQQLTTNGAVVKLVDFGIAKSIPLFDQETHGLTSTGMLIGSPAYMSPEQCVGEDLGEQSDIYSLGCVMYETLTGQPPFTAKNSIKAIMDHVKSDPARFASKVRIVDQASDNNFDIANYRQAIESVVLKCLEKDPGRRYQSADQLRLDLECLSDNKIPKLTSNEKAIGSQFAKVGNWEGALAIIILVAILLLVLAVKLLQTAS
ncbi:serine/threonine protein kinase [bacterium]|nr:serine/threonine protein kinase [bacterium]MBP9807102.1 serine/threonine protein kinase [bacterium]